MEYIMKRIKKTKSSQFDGLLEDIKVQCDRHNNPNAAMWIQDAYELRDKIGEDEDVFFYLRGFFMRGASLVNKR